MKSNLPIDEALYEQGYNQAIKDLALTWKDIETIIRVTFDVFHELPIGSGDEKICTEILKRFNEKRTSHEHK